MNHIFIDSPVPCKSNHFFWLHINKQPQYNKAFNLVYYFMFQSVAQPPVRHLYLAGHRERLYFLHGTKGTVLFNPFLIKMY